MDAPQTHYTVLARRFRPQTFDDVIGQQHVAQALKNAIQSGRVAHAYLFTGARGVGKTSMARILAKALNCPNIVDGVPCNQCEICRGIAAGNDVDVLEIDGASNRGIDDIRTLRANVSVKSMRTKFKVYIIDEVHMLTKEAFNALLKTLEEPPPNVKFVFCTTEPNKVPDTILSRCQRFDFAAIETQNIIQRLHEIAVAEGYEVDQAALELIARRAAGSMRDSQSLFDQLLAFGSEHITPQDVHRLFGTADDERLVALADALVNRDRETALADFGEAISSGVQLGEFFDQLIHYFRDLMILASGANKVGLMGVAESCRPDLQRQAETWGLETVVASLQILIEAKTKMFRSVYPRALAELALVRITLLEDLDAIAALARDLRDGGTASRGLPTTTQRTQPSSQKNVASNRPVPQNRPRNSQVDTSPPQTDDGKSQTISENGVTSNESASVPSEPALPTVELRPGNESALMAQLVENADDATRVHLKPASLAISGPNRLDLLFSASYHFPKQYCDRPEIRTRLERIASQITGQPITLSVQIDESAPAAPDRTDRANKAESAVERKSAVDLSQAENDAFVQMAVSIFDGTVKKVEPLSAPRGGN